MATWPPMGVVSHLVCFDHARILNTWKTIVTDTDWIRISICKIRIRIVRCGYRWDTDSKNGYYPRTSDVNIHVTYECEISYLTWKFTLQFRCFSLSNMNLQVKLLQVSTILREYSRNIRSAKFYILREDSFTLKSCSF